jgi:NADPH:quinone reductase-like Zn-dependent oxidoreductase
MKAYEIRQGFGIEALTLQDRPEPAAGPGEVLLGVRAVSLNYRDLLVVKGQYNPKMPLPRIPCSDAAGEVLAVGPGVKRVREGQRVCGLFMPAWQAGQVTEEASRSALGGAVDGVLAERVVLPEDGVIPIPEHLSDEEAATLPCAALTAWHALISEGQLQPGSTVLLQGTGGVSLFALQFARLAGARVIITSSQDDKLSRAKSLGAADGINYKTTPEWGEQARRLSGGAGVDQVVEVGGAGTLAQSLRAVRLGGRVSLIGVLSGGGGQLSLFPILMKNVRIQGIYVGSREMFEAMNRAVAEHDLRPVVDRVFAFAEAVEAFRYLESGSHFGKVCIRVAG